MGSRSATELLQLPVQLRGIRLGGPVDLLLHPTEWRALGLVVLCGDESTRYRHRSRSLLGLLSETVESGLRELGELRDLLLLPNGSVKSLVVERDEGIREVRSAVTITVEPERVSTA
jgi:hypothetical protein